MKKIVRVTLTGVLMGLFFLSAGTVTAGAEDNWNDESPKMETTGREFQPWEEGYEYSGYAPAYPVYPQPYPAYPAGPTRVVPLPRDVRKLIAERELLKANFHYYSLSPYPGNQERAAWTFDRLRDVESRIEAWHQGYR